MGQDTVAALDEAYQRARVAIANYRLPEAREHLDTARGLLLAVAPDDRFEPELRIRLTESWLILDDVGIDAALEHVAAGRRDAEAGDRTDLRGLAHIQAGVLNARNGRVQEGLAELRLAVALSGALPVDDRVRLLINKGAVGSQAGELDEAAADLGEAASLATHLPEFRFMATHNLGFVEYLRGDLPAALRWMAAADDLDADVDRSVSRLDRARVLLEVGLVNDAVDLLELATSSMTEAHLTDELAEARLELARCALLLGHTAEAVRMVDLLIHDSAERDDGGRELEARALRLEALGAEPGIPAPDLVAEALALVSAGRLSGNAWLVERCCAWWVILAGRAGMPVDEGSVRRELQHMRSSPYLATRSLAVMAQLELSSSDARQSQLLRTAARDVGRARAGMSNLDLRTAVAIHVSPVMEFEMQRAVQSRNAWAALTATERWRTALDSVPSVLPPSDPEAAHLWSGLRQRHEDLRAAAPTAAGALRSEVRRIEHQLRERAWAGNTVTAMRTRQRPRRSDLAGATVLSYFFADDDVWVVRLVPGRRAELMRMVAGSRARQLLAATTADANAAARVGHGLLAAGVLGSLADSLTALQEALLPAELGEGQVVIVPGGGLAHVPWGMLPRLRTRSVTVSRSLTAWHTGTTRLTTEPAVTVATGPGLQMAQAEADAVSSCWPGSVSVASRPGDVAAALAAHDVVHIAAHGEHRADNPLFSSLRLHGGALFAHELEGVALTASLVVLSSCSAGRAEARPGDEALGLTSSLLAMGVVAVVAPLTDVPDAVACATMTLLHKGLAAGLDGPAALAAASDGVLARSFTWFGSAWKATRK